MRLNSVTTSTSPGRTYELAAKFNLNGLLIQESQGNSLKELGLLHHTFR